MSVPPRTTTTVPLSRPSSSARLHPNSNASGSGGTPRGPPPNRPPPRSTSSPALNQSISNQSMLSNNGGSGVFSPIPPPNRMPASPQRSAVSASPAPAPLPTGPPSGAVSRQPTTGSPVPATRPPPSSSTSPSRTASSARLPTAPASAIQRQQVHVGTVGSEGHHAEEERQQQPLSQAPEADDAPVGAAGAHSPMHHAAMHDGFGMRSSNAQHNLLVTSPLEMGGGVVSPRGIEGGSAPEVSAEGGGAPMMVNPSLASYPSAASLGRSQPREASARRSVSGGGGSVPPTSRPPPARADSMGVVAAVSRSSSARGVSPMPPSSRPAPNSPLRGPAAAAATSSARSLPTGPPPPQSAPRAVVLTTEEGSPLPPPLRAESTVIYGGTGEPSRSLSLPLSEQAPNNGNGSQQHNMSGSLGATTNGMPYRPPSRGPPPRGGSSDTGRRDSSNPFASSSAVTTAAPTPQRGSVLHADPSASASLGRPPAKASSQGRDEATSAAAVSSSASVPPVSFAVTLRGGDCARLESSGPFRDEDAERRLLTAALSAALADSAAADPTAAITALDVTTMTIEGTVGLAPGADASGRRELSAALAAALQAAPTAASGPNDECLFGEALAKVEASQARAMVASGRPAPTSAAAAAKPFALTAKSIFVNDVPVPVSRRERSSIAERGGGALISATASTIGDARSASASSAFLEHRGGAAGAAAPPPRRTSDPFGQLYESISGGRRSSALATATATTTAEAPAPTAETANGPNAVGILPIQQQQQQHQRSQPASRSASQSAAVIERARPAPLALLASPSSESPNTAAGDGRALAAAPPHGTGVGPPPPREAFPLPSGGAYGTYNPNATARENKQQQQHLAPAPRFQEEPRQQQFMYPQQQREEYTASQHDYYRHAHQQQHLQQQQQQRQYPPQQMYPQQRQQQQQQRFGSPAPVAVAPPSHRPRGFSPVTSRQAARAGDYADAMALAFDPSRAPGGGVRSPLRYFDDGYRRNTRGVGGGGERGPNHTSGRSASFADEALPPPHQYAQFAGGDNYAINSSQSHFQQQAQQYPQQPSSRHSYNQTSTPHHYAGSGYDGREPSPPRHYVHHHNNNSLYAGHQQQQRPEAINSYVARRMRTIDAPTAYQLTPSTTAAFHHTHTVGGGGNGGSAPPSLHSSAVYQQQTPQQQQHQQYPQQMPMARPINNSSRFLTPQLAESDYAASNAYNSRRYGSFPMGAYEDDGLNNDTTLRGGHQQPQQQSYYGGSAPTPYGAANGLRTEMF